MDQLLREFLAEAEDSIGTLFRDIQSLREQHGEGRARRELTGRIFRHVHTLKGTAAAAGLDITSQIAHEFETLLDGVRRGRVSLKEPVLDSFNDAAHALLQTLGATARGETPVLPLQLLENLRHLAESDDDEQARHHFPRATLTLLPEEITRMLSPADAQRLREAAAEGQRIFFINVTFDLETFDQRFRELSEALGQSGELISTLPGAEESAPGAINFRLLYASQMSFEELSAVASAFGHVSIEELQPEASSRSERGSGASDEELILSSTSAETIAPLATQVRVELGKVDELISAAHELLTETMATLDQVLEDNPTLFERSRVEARAIDIHQRFIELEEQLIGLRRVPLAQTLERVTRAGQMAARAIGKEIAFETAGVEVRLDKTLVEAISDPLLHLVRNAVDHGIETPAERTGAGKHARGTVRLEALASGDRVILKVTDDGRGIDLESVARAAVEHGIIEAGRSVTREQALRLIFRPGFTTAAVVSKMSGRGVGLDVVERAVEQIGGEMRVWSETGQGTTFEMIVPVALALLSALVVTSADFSYCVDARRVGEVCNISAVDVRHAENQELIDWRGTSLPLVRLRKLLGQPPAEEETDGSWPVIIVTTEKNGTQKEASEQERTRVAVLVDECVEGRAEVLVRRLGAHGGRWAGVNGAAELSDGKLALVLDLPRLLEPYADHR
ncbi:MAG TPA: ATP-binding protein [Pyrinomonadaceae bacterium]|jgi:two-component system chemotaxis sensor kinase CheA